MKARTLIVRFIPIVTLCGWTIPLAGQDVIDGQLRLAVPEPLGVIDFGIQAQKQQEATARRLREGAERYLAIRIDQMRRVCQLSDQQVKTFEVAAKGAVQQFLEKWQQRMQPLGERIEFGGVADVDIEVGDAPAGAVEFEAVADELVPEDDPEPDVHPPDEAFVVFQADGAVLQAQARAWPAARIARALVVANDADVSAISAITDEPVWAKTIDRVLTEEQRQAMHQGAADRVAFRRLAAVNNLVAQVDETLLLSGEQRQQLAKLMAEAIDDPFGDPALVVSQLAWRIPIDKLEHVLSDAQLAKWDDLKAGVIDEKGRGRIFLNGGFFRVEDAARPAIH